MTLPTYKCDFSDVYFLLACLPTYYSALHSYGGLVCCLKVLRTDIVMDVGKSINPAIDVGQIEGAFLQVIHRKIYFRNYIHGHV